MKMIQLQPHKDIYAIPVPLAAHGYNDEDIYQNCIDYFIGYFGVGKIELPSGNWQVLGEVTKDSISFDVSGIVQGNNGGYDDTMFRDYQVSERDFFIFTFETRNESFCSLLADNGLHFENPCGNKKPQTPEECGVLMTLNWYQEQWQSYEDILVEKVLIVKYK